MAEIIHRPTVVGAVGKVDSWGFGSRSTIWEWPTLPGRPKHLRTPSTGGVNYPEIAGAEREHPGRREYAPDQVWQQEGLCFRTEGGTLFRPEVRDGQEVMVEVRS